MVAPIRQKVTCVCGLLRGLHSHRRGRYVVFKIGYKKDGEEVITKLQLQCLTCGVQQTFNVEEIKDEKKRKIL